MIYISSDTNVWLDYDTAGYLELPFRLPYTYLMNDEVAEKELIYPADLGSKLVDLGLELVELTEEEFYLAEEYTSKYLQPSDYDCIALAIAKARGIALMTGDRVLRNAAIAEGVKVVGTIGILDELYRGDYISETEYKTCIERFVAHNGRKIRLPEEELFKRLEQFE